MAKSIRVKPRFWIVLMVLFIAVFTPLFFILDSHSNRLTQTQAELTRAQAELYARESEIKLDLDYVRSNKGIEQHARALGMIMEGEVQYVAGGE